MSTERPTRGDARRRRRSRAFFGAFALVVSVLAVVGLAGAVVTTVQGPRVTAVQVDPAAAVAASGSRLIVTTTQSLRPVDTAQVTIEPATPFTVDTSGRSVGVRFTLPLHDETQYTVTIDAVQGAGGGPEATVTETFTTPPIDVFVLRRGVDGADAIFRTDLTGEQAVPVFEHAHIEDFRATATHLVISVQDDDGHTSLLATDLDGGSERELSLPGEGTVTNLQSADRGELVGFTYTDGDIDADSGIESGLFTISLKETDAAPTRVAIAGDEPRVDDWRFVPDTDSLLVLTFDGRLMLSAASGADPVALGAAIAIDGIARGAALAVVERPDGMVTIDLADGTDTALALPSIGGTANLVRAMPLPVGAGTLQTVTHVDGFTPLGTTVEVVGSEADATARTVFEAAATDSVLQTCVSPSGRYAAVLVAPDVVSNPYDLYALPLPEKVETHVVEVADGSPVVALTGFDVSWCQVPPR